MHLFSHTAGLLRACLSLLVVASPPALAQGGGFGDSGSFFGGARDDTPAAVVTAVPSSPAVRPGDQLTLALTMTFKEGWHAWPAAEQDVLPDGFGFAIRTAAGLAETPGWIGTVGRPQWPEPHPARVADPAGTGTTVEVPTYSGTAVVYIPLLVSEDAEPGTYTLTASVVYQACDESMCLPPEEARVPVDITVDPAAGAADVPGVFSDFDASVYADLSAGSVAPATTPARRFFGVTLPGTEGVVGVLVTALLAMVGGFVLNLTPCVLPVIPLKIMAISQHAASPGKSFVLGVWMSLGVIAFWVGIGLPVVLFASVADPSRIFGVWWVTLGIGLIIGAMGIGIMGVLTITLPQKVYMVNPSVDSAHGSFLFGVMTAVLGLPCFGFVAGALLAGSATMPPALIMTIFTSMGVGMALPYFVLSAKPKLVDSIPRTGPASELVKQVMGLLLLAAAAYFAGSGVLGFLSERPSLAHSLPWWSKVVHWWAVALFAVAAGGWLLVRTLAITKSLPRRAFFSAVALVLGGAAVLYAADTTDKAKHNFWVPFDQTALDAALAADQVVVVDFTAEWCLNCKALKAVVLTKEPVVGELIGAGVTPMVADLTSSKAPGWEKLREIGQTGIPTLAVYGPGFPDDQPWVANAYTPEQVMDALARARGVDITVSR